MELSRLDPLVMESGSVDWRGGRYPSAFHSGVGSQRSAGWSQNLVGSDREMMGSYWSGKSCHCVAAGVESTAAAVVEEMSLRWR